MSGWGGRFWRWPEELRRGGVLGINRRNLEYIIPNNPRAHYPNVDNKLKTKEICQENGIPVPDTYAVIRNQSELKSLNELLAERRDFVVKPAHGAAGRGIVVIAGRRTYGFKTPSGNLITYNDLRYHISTTISGAYSLGGQVDQAIIERRIISHPTLVGVTVGGTPDIRVILYHGVPVMAMVRLPTSESGGRANLHQGAVAAAVHLVAGVTFGGVCRNRAIDRHPDTNEPIAGIEIPQWKALLEASMKLSDSLQMGYVGVDFVIDSDIGPVVLEANARPGLAIQVAHREGLLPRLAYVDAQHPESRKHEGRWDMMVKLAGMSHAH
ncbi:MAG: alpha-L-glutamate ligase-like protein [Planctomycetales bacterium]|nr:alpha-L-glutamate ligase-like protein [Planctomycetales bacterium]